MELAETASLQPAWSEHFHTYSKSPVKKLAITENRGALFKDDGILKAVGSTKLGAQELSLVGREQHPG